MAHRPARRAVPPAPHRRGPVGGPGVHRGAAIALNGPALLDATVNGRPQRGRRRRRTPTAATYPAMAPHGIYPCRERRPWVAIACRNDEDWARARRRHRRAVGQGRRAARRSPAGSPPRTRSTTSSPAWTAATRAATTSSRRSGPPACRSRPCSGRRSACDDDPDDRGVGAVADGRSTAKHGAVRVDGLPVHLSATDWQHRARRAGARRGQRAGATPRCSGCRRPRSAGCADEGVDLMPARSTGVTGGRAVARARRLGRQARSPTSAPTSSSSSRPAARAQRRYGPFLDDEPGPGAQPVVVALQHVASAASSPTCDRRSRAHAGASSPTPTSSSRARRRARWPPSASTGDAVQAVDPRLVIVSITPFGRTSDRAARAGHRPHAAGRAAARCGAAATTTTRCRRCAAAATRRFHTAGNWAVMSVLVALLDREETGAGPAHRRQHARRQQRHDRDGDVRLAGLPVRRCSARPGATPTPVLTPPMQVRCARRALRHDRRPAARRRPSSPRSSTCSTGSGCATSSRRRCILELGAERRVAELRRHRDRPDGRRDLHGGPRGHVVPRRAPRRLRLLRRDASASASPPA